MNVEILLWVLLPMVVGVGTVAASLYSVKRRPSEFQIAATSVVIAGVAWAEWVLYQMVRGAWPTFLPHVVIALFLPLVFVQVWRAKANAE